MPLLGQSLAFYTNSIGDLVMALCAAFLSVWVYRNGPSSNRVMLRYWVVALLFLSFGGFLGAILESTRQSLLHEELLSGRLGLVALYMAAGLFQLFAVLEIVYPGRWGKDLLMGGSGAAYLIVLVISFIYLIPEVKIYFLLYSSFLSLIILLSASRKHLRRFQWLLVGATSQLAGVVIYFLEVQLLGLSYSLLFNILMFLGLLGYLKGLQRMAQMEETSVSINAIHSVNSGV